MHEDNAGVSGVRFAPNGGYVLAWTVDGCVRLWDHVGGGVKKTFQGHGRGWGEDGGEEGKRDWKERWFGAGTFGVYGEDGKDGGKRAFVVSGSERGELVVWDVRTKEILQRLKGHQEVVLGVDTQRGFKDRKPMMVSCSLDKTIRLYEEVDYV